MDVGLLLLRVVVGLTMAAHGGQKLFGWFRGPGRDGFRAQLASLGFGSSSLLVWIAGGAELIGGALLTVGLLTPLAAAAVLGVMVAAAVVVHAGNGFFAAGGGYELPAVIGTVAATLALTGPGAHSVDAALGLGLSGPTWAAAAISIGLVAGLGVGAVHRRLRAKTGGALRTA